MIYFCLFATLFCLTYQTNPEIRIANHSSVPLENVRVRFPSQTEEYGTIPSQGVTEYRVIGRAYRYALIKATVSGEEVVIQPIDFVGEKELRAGKYTYVLTINNKSTSRYNRLKLALRKD
jgi:hypothetical protein